MCNQELGKKVRKLKKLKRAADDLATEIKNLEDELKSEMNSRGEYTLCGKDWKVSWNLVKSNRFDSRLFKQDNPHLYEQYQAIQESRRFLLS